MFFVLEKGTEMRSKTETLPFEHAKGFVLSSAALPPQNARGGGVGVGEGAIRSPGPLRALGGRRCPRGSAEQTLRSQGGRRVFAPEDRGLDALQGPCSFSLNDTEPPEKTCFVKIQIAF